MRLKLANGEDYPAELVSVGYVNYVRAAFCYEHEARVNQHKSKAKRPIYRFKKPFPELSQKQKDLLRRDFPSRGWQAWPWERSQRTTPLRELAMRPPRGWIDLHFWVNPAAMSRNVVIKGIKAYLDERNFDKLRKRKRSPVRTKPYSWKSLEILDNYLSGTATNEYDKSHARLVLNRTY